MTLANLFKLVKHYFVLFIVAIILCALFGCAVGFFKASNDAKAFLESQDDDAYSGLFMAHATLLVSTQIGGVEGIANAEAELWNQENNERYDQWLVAENERMQNQLDLSTNTTSKKSIETSPGSWLKGESSESFKDLTIVECEANEDSNTVLIVAIGPDSQKCIDAANSVAEKTEMVSHDLFDVQTSESKGTTYNLGRSNILKILGNDINITLIKANSTTPAYPMVDQNVLLSANSAKATQVSSNEIVEPNTIKTVLKYGIVGFAAGFILSLILIIIIDFYKKPLKNPEYISETLEVPVLADRNNIGKADMVFQNIELAAGKDSKCVSLASINDTSASSCVFNILETHENKKKEYIDAGSLCSSGKSILDISESDCVVLCMREWKDSILDLENALNELTITSANLIGIVVLSDK